MGKTLVIVESPAKAKTIGKYLGGDYQVIASVGHIRDLASKVDELPARFREEPRANYSIDSDGYRPVYIINEDKKKLVGELQTAAAQADRILFATDDDREGEAISWHLAELLNVPKPTRMVFHEITKDAVREALEGTRPLDRELVEAQETRRILDRYVGWDVSRLLNKLFYWGEQKGEKSPMALSGLSAGRVQSAALMIAAQRDLARMSFKPATYHMIKADTDTDPSFTAQVQAVITDDHPEGLPLAKASHFNKKGELKDGAEVTILSKKEVDALKAELEGAEATIVSVEEKETASRPAQPFTTATLNSAASKKLGFTLAEATDLAQELYNGGFITYIRTDSPALSDEAIEAARAQATSLFGEDAVPEKGRQYATRNTSAQEAHEAIRPSGKVFKTPKETGLTGKQLELYTLIYQRTVASQMKDALYDRTTVTMHAAGAILTAQGRVLKQAGYTQLLADEQEEKEGEEAQNLPALAEGETLHLSGVEAKAKKSSPPSRFSDAALSEYLEKIGLTRPSTSKSTVATLIDREYLTFKGKQLGVTAKGLLITSYLNKNLPALLTRDLTAQMEAGLDEIAHGKYDRVDYLDKFWQAGLHPQIEACESKPPAVNIPHLEGVKLMERRGQPYIVQGEQRGAIPVTTLIAEIKQKDLAAIFKGGWKQGKRASRKKKAS